MPRQSQALKDFRSSLSIAKTLMKREARFADPPQPRYQKIVQGLRGGAAVLMVAAFENFLKEVVEEYFYELTLHPLRFDPLKVPEEMLFQNLNQTFDRLIKGPFPIGWAKSDKIAAFRQASSAAVQGVINSKVFSDAARSNPNSKKVRELFKNIGIPDIYVALKPDFDVSWGVPTAGSFIQDKLDEILDRRHEVAHTANMLNVSRLDLEVAVRFLEILAILCDKKIESHVRSLK